MKKIFYVLLWGGLLLFAGCHDITVGYLYTDEAEYPVDRMEIYNIPQRIEELQGKLDDFNDQAAALQTEYNRANAVYTAAQAEVDEYRIEVLVPVADSIDKILQPGVDDAKIAELKKRQEEVIFPHMENLTKVRDDAQAELKKAEKAINDLADQLGIESPLIVQREIDKLKNRVAYDIPWTTSSIQGVAGTEPLIYEIEEVKNANPENAALFRKKVGVIGGGRIYVEFDVSVPAGEYVVSIRVSNEGRSRVFVDAFTFVVTP